MCHRPVLLLSTLTAALAILIGLSRYYDLTESETGASEKTTTLSSRLNCTVHWMAPFLSGGGYCSEAISYVFSLRDLVPKLSIDHHGDMVNRAFIAGLPISDRQKLGKLLKQVDGADICICHSEPGAWHPALYKTSICPPPQCKYKIGRTMFETDRIPREWVERLNKMDEIWVPTDFHIEVFAQNGVQRDKLVAIPQGVDVEFFNPHRESVQQGLRLPGGSGADFKFLSVFKFEKRKAWDVLLTAYFREFTSKDSVALYILTNQYHCEDGDPSCTPHLLLASFARNYSLTNNIPIDNLPNVHLIDYHIPQSKLPNLYKSVDAFVLPTRGEGWGRPTVEAMSMALPVITTNWSGATAYLNQNNSYPLNIDGLEPVGEGPFADHMWATPSVQHLQQLMRHVYEHREEAKQKGIAARETMIRHYTPDLVAEVVFHRLANIAKNIKCA